MFQARPRLALAARPFTLERQCRDGQHERAGFPGDARQHRAGARACASAQTGHNHDNPRAGAELAQRFGMLLRRRAADFRIAARAETARHGSAQGHHAFERQAGQRLDVRVQRRELDACKTALREVRDGVAARPAHADHFQGEVRFEPFLARDRCGGSCHESFY